MTQSAEFRETEQRVGGAGGADGRGQVSGQVSVASFVTYSEAERAVDYLSDHNFPVEQVAIVGRGLSTVEQVTGRMTIWGAAGRGALAGAVTGALVGWIFGLLDWINPLISGLLLALYGLIFGAVLGGALGLVGHLFTGGRRDFASVTAMRADHYELMVSAEFADRARQKLAEVGPATGPATG